MTNKTPDGSRLSVNDYGVVVSLHRCAYCGDEFTVCPPAGEDWGDGCLAKTCPSYNPARDADKFFGADGVAGPEVRRE